jgi:hypothetical protein
VPIFGASLFFFEARVVGGDAAGIRERLCRVPQHVSIARILVLLCPLGGVLFLADGISMEKRKETAPASERRLLDFESK